MNHKFKKAKLNRTAAHRGALLANIACSLIQHGEIKTTLPKAKTLRPFVEKLVTKSRSNSLGTYKLLLSRLKRKDVVKKLVEEVSQKYKERQGGYLRILKIGFRPGDNAPMAMIQFV